MNSWELSKTFGWPLVCRKAKLYKKLKIDKTIKIESIYGPPCTGLAKEYVGQEVSSPLFCLDAGKQDSPQKSSLYAKKVAPKNLKVLPFNVKEKEMRKKPISK